MADGLDYAFYPHPSPSAIRAEGASFACRYVSAFAPNDGNGKNLLAAEKGALLGAGISVVIVAEEGSSRMLGGGAAGVADAQHAGAVVNALGMPSIPIYFACDWDATEAQQALINAYLDGCASVIGRARTGIYGGYWPVSRALDAGKAAYAWQTYAWSSTNWDPRVQIRQTQNGVSIGGADCDRDVSMAADFGQWPRPASTPPSHAPMAAAPVAASVAGQLPTPTALAIDRTRLALGWHAVTGPGLTGYTVAATGLSGKEYARTTTPITQPWCVLNGLVPGWTYTVRVWPNGGAVAPKAALLTVTLPT